VVWGQFQAQLIDAVTGELVGAALPAMGSTTEPTNGVELLRQHIMDMFAARIDPKFADYRNSRKTRPASYQAYREFLAGERIVESPCPKGRNCYAEAVGRYWNAYALDSSFMPPLIAVMEQSAAHGECDRTDSLVAGLRLRQDLLSTSDRSRLDRAVTSCRTRPGARNAKTGNR
jgi:hypothetical protein